MWFRGPDADFAWFILIFVIVSLGAILGKFYILNKKKQSDESARADLKASKTFIVICILTLILVPSGIIMYDNYIYQAKDIIDRADGQVKQADSKSNTIKKLLEIAGRLGRSAETAEEAKKLEEISKKLRGPKNNKNLTKEDIALLDKYRSELNPKFKPAPAPVIKTVPDLLKANEEVSEAATKISQDVAKKIESKEFVLLPGLEYVPAKDGKPAFIFWDGKTMNTGILHNGKKYTETGTYRGEATPGELRSVGIEPTAKPAPAPEKAPSATEAKPESGTEQISPEQAVDNTITRKQVEDDLANSIVQDGEVVLHADPQDPMARYQRNSDKAVENIFNRGDGYGDMSPEYRAFLKRLEDQAREAQEATKQKELSVAESVQPNTTANIANKQTEPAVHPAEEVPKVDQINDPGTPPPKQEPGVKPGFKDTSSTRKSLKDVINEWVANPPKNSKDAAKEFFVKFGPYREELQKLPLEEQQRIINELKSPFPFESGPEGPIPEHGDFSILWESLKSKARDAKNKVTGANIGQKVKDFAKDKLGIENDKYQSVDNWLESTRDWVQSKLLGEYPKAYWDAASKWVSSAGVKAKAKAQAKANAKANERILKEYGPEEWETFGAKPNAEQAPKAGPVPEGASAAGSASTTPNAGARPRNAAVSDFVKAMLNPKENGKQLFHGAKAVTWDPVFHPLKTVGRAVKGVTGAALGTTSAATMMHAGLNATEDGQPVSWWDMVKNLPKSIYNQITGEADTIPNQTTISPAPNRSENNGSKDRGDNAEETNTEETSTDSQDTATNANQNPGTVVTSWLPESFKNISVNDYPVGGSLFGALAGGALGAGFGGLNYILTDENELSEEEKKKRSLAKAMLSSAGIGAGIGGAIGGLDDWGRSSATPKKT